MPLVTPLPPMCRWTPVELCRSLVELAETMWQPTVCVAAADANGSGVLPTHQSYVLACRWVGENMAPKPQGAMGDGFSTVSECSERLVQMKPAPPPYPEMKPYRLAVALTFYTFMVVSVKIGTGVWGLAKKSFRPRKKREHSLKRESKRNSELVYIIHIIIYSSAEPCN
jgi:hypothetical protein